MLKRPVILISGLVLVGLVVIGGYFIYRNVAAPSTTGRISGQDQTYYVSFDNYYYEVPKQKAVDDKIVIGGQFLYNFNTGIKTNTLDDLFNDGAIAVQALIALNGDREAFERYINEAIKPAAANAFKGTSEVIFADREADKVRVAEVISKKDNVIVRRQYIINLAQSVNVISKDDGEAFRKIGSSIGLASAKFSDYERMKLLVLGESFMLSNRMFEDIYRLAHEDLRGATSVDELNRFADKSKEIFTLEAKVSGVTLRKEELTATIHYSDNKNPANTKLAVLQFRQAEGVWKLFALQLPGGLITGAPAAAGS